MATTSLWHIKGRLKDLINYVENPEKTASKMPELQDLYNVFSYVQRPEATQEGEYVTAINCLKETALRQMILTKKRYGKTDGYIAWHGYQSFKPEEVTPQLAHEIGVKLAKEMWGDRFEIIVSTHLDKEHLHCHFCFNSVSFRDGGKYNYSKIEQLRLREASDRLCREYGLSVIEKPHKAPSRPVWLDEKSGKPTRYNVYRADVREAMEFSRTPYYMEDYLRRKGYVTDFTGKHWKIRLPQYEHFTRLDTLDERWTPENIRRSMGRYATFGNRRAYISYPPKMPQELSDWFRPFHKTSHIYKLYLHYCYLLGYLPKHTDYKPTSPYLKEDLRKLDELSQQVRYMSKYGIETFDDLYADREKIQRDMDTLIARRTKLQNRIRRAAPAEKETLRQEKAGVTEQIIREKVVEQIVLESMQRILLNVQVFEKEFARKQMDCYTEDKKKLLAVKRRGLGKVKKRIAEIDTLIQKIYEDNASGKLSDERYATLSLSYEEEQKTLKASVPEKQTYLETEMDKTASLQRFIQKVKQITELKALTPELIHEFVDKIVVYAPRYLDGKRVQLLDIYYSGVGILHELTPEEMEEAFQHHLAERSKEKTA